MVLMDSLCENLNKAGVYADSFDTSLIRFFSPKGQKKPILVSLYKLTKKLPYGKRFFERHFLHRLIMYLIKDYDIIDVQSLFKPMYGYLVPKFKEKGKKVKVHIWGSDFYMDIPDRVRWQVKVYDKADIIQIATEQMKSDFFGRFPQYEHKVRIGVFGNQQLDNLIEFHKHPEKQDLSFIRGDYQDKLIVTCGYNARSRHQHLKMIEALDKLPHELLDSIFVIFPMTYLRENNYLKQVEDALKNVRFSYVMINDYMTENQLMSLRTMTDLYINIIESDALSSSTQEHLFCGNVVIVGDWLPYSIFEENGLFYIKTSLEQLYHNIFYALTHMEELKKKSAENPARLYRITSWESAIPKFKEIYEEMLH